MLWHSGVIWPSLLTIVGTAPTRIWTSLGFLMVLLRVVKGGGVRMSVRNVEAASAGSCAPMMALTTATPSRALNVAFDWYRTR